MKFLKEINSINWEKLFLELLVVFLGVTAGFILNNYKSERQAEELELKYLNSFLKDAEYNLNELQDFHKEDSTWMAWSIPFIKQFRDKSTPLDSASSLFLKIMMVNNITPKKGTYEDITNSGNLNLIQNFGLKEAIVNYHLELEDAKFLYQFFQEYFNNFVLPFVLEEFDLINNEPRSPEIIHSHKFSNMFIGYFAMVQQRRVMNDSLLVTNEGLIGYLKQELGAR
ncbi:MAG: hypothetical protein OCD76_19020 [Reichenbachiella sp.]